MRQYKGNPQDPLMPYGSIKEILRIFMKKTQEYFRLIK